MEAAFGLGMMLGPTIGSFVYGLVGYEFTMYYFALQTLIFPVVNSYVLPDSLNGADEEEGGTNDLSETERNILEGCNQL